MFSTLSPDKATPVPTGVAELRRQLLSAVIAERFCSPDLARHLECLEKAHGDETQCVGVHDALGRCQARVYSTPSQLMGLYKEADGRPECSAERMAVRRCRELHPDTPMEHCATDHAALNLCGLRSIAGDLGLSLEE